MTADGRPQTAEKRLHANFSAVSGQRSGYDFLPRCFFEGMLRFPGGKHGAIKKQYYKCTVSGGGSQVRG